MGSWNRTMNICLVLVVMAFLGSLGANGQTVVPNSLAAVEGNRENSIPFDDEGPVRYQQVYLGSEVGSIPDLSEIRFRQDEVWGEPFSGTIPEVTIVLTSIAAGPDGLSMVFSENLGADAAVVYSGPLTLTSSSTSGSPHEFDIVVPLQQTFAFDASTGLNLLMDVLIPAGPELTLFDAEFTEGDSVSRLYCWTEPECLTTDDAMIANTIGLVTMFLPEGSIFWDGFESGDTLAWSATVP